MDRRTAIALALCLLVFAVFTALQSKYMPKRRPVPPVAGAPGSAAPPPAAGGTPAAPGAERAPVNPTAANATPVPAATSAR